MTVSELIEELKNYDGNCQVIVDSIEFDDLEIRRIEFELEAESFDDPRRYPGLVRLEAS